MIFDKKCNKSEVIIVLIEIDIYSCDKTNSFFIVYTKLARRKMEIHYTFDFVVVGIVWLQSKRSITHCCLYLCLSEGYF